MKATVFAIAMLTAGCGTLFNEDNTEVELTAPEGVKLVVDGMVTPSGKTMLSNKRPHSVTAFNEDGSIRGTCLIDTTIRGKYVVGDVILGMWPLVVDVLTGGWTDLDKSSCSF